MIELTDPKIQKYLDLLTVMKNQYFMDPEFFGAFDEKKAVDIFHLFSGIRTSIICCIQVSTAYRWP